MAKHNLLSSINKRNPIREMLYRESKVKMVAMENEVQKENFSIWRATRIVRNCIQGLKSTRESMHFDFQSIITLYLYVTY